MAYVQTGSPTGVPHPVVAAAFAALDRSGVPWALIRGADDLVRPPGDVDILVGGLPGAALDDVLDRAGMRRMGVRGHGSHRFAFAYDAVEGLWVKLDVVSRVDFGPHQELRTPLAPGCLERRVRIDGVWRLEPSDEAWLHLLHLLLDKGGVPAVRREAGRAAAGAASLTGQVPAHVDARAGVGAAERVVGIVAGGDALAVAGLAADLRRAWAGGQRTAVAVRRLRSRAERWLARPVPGHPAGLVTAVVGPDGAGKSTLIASIAAEFPGPTRVIHMGLWRTGRWDEDLARLPGGRLGTRTLRLLHSSATAHRERRRGRLVLLDRSVHDADLPGSVDESLGGRVLAALAHRTAPQPDLVLVLDAPGDLLFARKGEHSPAVLEERRGGYLDLAARLPDAVVLDATQPAGQVFRQGIAIVWDRFSPRPRPRKPASGERLARR